MTMAFDSSLFVFCLFGDGFLLFLTVYVVITLSDLECDYLNVQTCCSKLNKWVIPEAVLICIMTLFQILTWHWFMFLINIPMSVWLVYKILTIPMGNIGMYDPTEIHNRGKLKKHLQESMIRLGYYLLFFFIYLYNMILALLTSEKS